MPAPEAAAMKPMDPLAEWQALVAAKTSQQKQSKSSSAPAQ